MSTTRSKSDSTPTPQAETPLQTIAPLAVIPHHRGRYRKIIFFFVFNFIRYLWWEFVLRYTLGKGYVSRKREERLRILAARFRQLAVELGGVMIKLGQFVSTRIDILPESIIKELQGLQDEVPSVPFEAIKSVIHDELGLLQNHLTNFDREPVASASFGQVYRAQLGGEKVVVKVQRPGIRELVQTDLAALDVIARQAMRFGFIARRANLPELLNEFARVLWEELDYIAEANNAARFGDMFADDPGVYVPRVYRQYSSRRVLVLEDVSAIKVTDYAALEAAGIDRSEVARRLLGTYLPQVFIERFFHADPHPGNIFVYPLAQADAKRMGVSGGKGTPFYLIFVDYGMVGRLTPRIVEALRQSLISLGLRDARGIVESYDRLGLLMPGADKERIIEATRRAFDIVWGLNMHEMTRLSYRDMSHFGREFSDLLFAMPLRIPQDMIYLARCTGILSGMCTGLDPNFDPWKEMQPYVATLLEAGTLDEEEKEHRRLRELLQTWLKPETLLALMTEENLDLLLRVGRDYTVRAAQLPILADEFLRKAERGDLQTRLRLDHDLEKRLEKIERHNARLLYGMIFAALAISGTILWVSDAILPGIGALILAGMTWLRLMWT